MKCQRGFTLIEMAIVLMIIGLLLGIFLIPFSTKLTQQQNQQTEQQLEAIQEALFGFAIVKGRLPCPAKDVNGREDSTFCGQEGYLPWLNLGVEGYDAWGQLFRYRADEQYTNAFLNPPTTSSELEVQDRQSNLLTAFEDNTNPINERSRVIALIFSYGKDREANDKNKILDNIYVQDVYIENQFDDILIWLPKSLLINRLVVAGAWSS